METTQGLILVDVPAGPAGEFEQETLERLGHPVLVCHGPDQGTLCPILAGTGCEKVESAHGIVFQLDLERPQHRAILARYRELVRPDVPIRVVVDPAQADRYPELLEGLQVWMRQPTAGDLDALAAEVETLERFGPA